MANRATHAYSQSNLRWLRYWADLLDSRFRIPGTNIRFGLDPLLSLIPGLGDLASPAYTVLLLMQGLRLRVPRVVMARMVLNALFDAILGIVPIAGNIGDIFWRANQKNLGLLERHVHLGLPPTRSDHIFVWATIVLFLVIVIVPVAVAMWVAYQLWRATFGHLGVGLI